MPIQSATHLGPYEIMLKQMLQGLCEEFQSKILRSHAKRK